VFHVDVEHPFEQPGPAHAVELGRRDEISML
jgi:hypothetical protein